MLDRTPNAAAEAGWIQAEIGETVTLADAVAFLRRRFWLIAGTVMVALTLAVLYVVVTPAEFVASAQLLIEPGKQQALLQDSSVVDLTIDSAQVESQVAVLKSERIASAVITGLGLADDPDFSRSAAASDYERQRLALAQFENALSARRVGQSYVIEVAFRSRDPAKAAQITNAIADAYRHDQQEAKSEVARQASQWMEDRITELGIKLNTAAAAVQEFRVSHGIVDTATNNQPRLIDKLTELEARAQAYRKVYETFLEKLTENQQQASYPVANARIITPASRPLVKTYPKAGLVLLLSMLIGLVIGIAIAAARAMLDGSVQSAKSIRQVLDLACLGTLPAYRVERGAAAARYIEIVDAPFSPFSEAIRNVKISAQNACRGRPGCCIGVVALRPGEGASTVALNLAAVFAASDAATLLVDADCRARTLSQKLAPGARSGLVEAVRAGAAEAIIEAPRGTRLLPIAAGQPPTDAADLLGSAGMQVLLPQLKERFATIIVDLPPLARAVDARAMAPLLDGCILVAAHGRTPLRGLEEAVELLRADDVALLGVVITGVPVGIPPLFGLHWEDVRPAIFGRRAARSASR